MESRGRARDRSRAAARGGAASRPRRRGAWLTESVSRTRHDQVIAHLLRGRDWVTAAELAGVVGVTPRSIRSYVTAINARVPAGTAVESGPRGYRAGPEAAQALHAVAEAPSTRDRLHRLVRALLESPEGIEVFDTAAAFFVSPATLEADLARVRALLGGTQLTLHRTASRAFLRGPETAQRRLLSRLAHDEMEASAFDLAALQRALGADAVEPGAFGRFKADLVAGLEGLGYVVNELSIGDVMMHVAIAADRVARERGLDEAPAPASAERAQIGELIDELAREHLGIRFGGGDLVAVGGQQQPAQHVQQEAEATEDGQDDEGNPDQDRVDPEDPADAAGHTRDLAVSARTTGAPRPPVSAGGAGPGGLFVCCAHGYQRARPGRSTTIGDHPGSPIQGEPAYH